jgi:hypothetical protein
MHKTFLGQVAAIALIAISQTASAASISIMNGPITNPSNGHRYYMLSPNTWTQSEVEAISLGGNLATIRSAAKNDWVYNTFKNPGDFLWIGLYDPVFGDGTGATHAADFRWISGETSAYRNWGNGEPNNTAGNGGEYYTAIAVSPLNLLVPKVWNDLSDSATSTPPITAAGIVEVVPEPASGSLLIVSFVVLVLFFRQCKSQGRARESWPSKTFPLGSAGPLDLGNSWSRNRTAHLTGSGHFVPGLRP